MHSASLYIFILMAGVFVCSCFGCLTIPKNCAIGGYTRTSLKDRDVSFFKFPQNEQVRRERVRFVTTTRADFKSADVTEWSRICSKHFDGDCHARAIISDEATAWH